MSIQNEIDRIREGVSEAYEVVLRKGGTLPGDQNIANLAAAIASIPYDPPRIYGVTWPGTTTNVLSRIDDSAEFSDPVPAVGNSAGSSPFDNCMPWSGMVRVTLDGNEMVAIPKFWVKVSHGPFKVEIADSAVEGFEVSPAHRDRGDGKGERSVVYVGRYECDGSYMSRAGQTPKTSATRTAFRSGIHAKGAEYWQADFALQLTLWYLYIVEYANWDTQTVIGQGNCGDGDSNSMIATGQTDSMTYHTGRAEGTDGKTAVQYRNIENLWGNVSEWRDGIAFSATDICTYSNPANFSDSYNAAGGVVRSNKRPSSTNYSIKLWGYDTADTSFIYPQTLNSSRVNYVPDCCAYNATGTILAVGGDYDTTYKLNGLFRLIGTYAATASNISIGSRIQKLPDAA